MSTTPPFQELLYTVEEGVATLTLNRPQKRNALTPTLVNELIFALETAAGDKTVGAIILTGAGEAFCAGADLKQMNAPGGKDSEIPHRGGFVELNLALTTVGKPVIAKVRKYALAGGLGLMCACHFAVAEDTATFSTPEIHRGIFPMMIMANIFRLIPRRKGIELILLGKRVPADEAVQMGLINKAVPADELDDAVHQLALELANRPPNTMRIGLEAFYEQSDMDYNGALQMLQTKLFDCLGTPDAQEGLMAFIQKRDPDWAKVRRES